MRKIPKRGFNSRQPLRYQIVNLDRLSNLSDDLITPELLQKNGLIRDKKLPVKILGSGSIKKAVTIKDVAFSKSAKTKIEQAGGRIEIGAK